MINNVGSLKWTVEEIVKRIDHTLLQAYASENHIRKLCEEAIEYRFFSVCVNPVYVPYAYKMLKNTDVKICTVVGFPLGSTFKEVKIGEAEQAVNGGASEIDMVVNIPMFKSGNYDYVEQEIRGVKNAIKDNVLKVIIECCYLTDEEKVHAAKIVERAGADFVKTSTGFGLSGAKVEDVKLLRANLSRKVKIKAAGGIRTVQQLIELFEAGAERIGTSSSIKLIQEYKSLLNKS